ncbi:hypothetical protein PBRA_005101 [Plasmodiophora brassicae]|uniref:Uncharacterized protein n=1 Tax=Plasmodiophora brassicae TaxID=37360 RepID=A0A0G4IMT7_PLABS|nr:hypothetical protein PBRA_005101 [Plasmodiophora brassicae]
MVLLFIKKTTGKTIAVDLDLASSVQTLKETLFAVEGFQPSRQTLIFAGRVLKDDAALSSYNISKECSIQLFHSAAPSLDDDASQASHGGDAIRPHAEGLVQLVPSVQDRKQQQHVPAGPASTASDRLASLPATKTSKSRAGMDAPGGVSDALKHGDIVIVKLIEARNLAKADFWPVLSRLSDPYVIFALGKNCAKSKIIRRNINPVWNETFGFRINEEDDQAVLRVLVFDFDNFTADHFIGSVEINLFGLQRGEMVDRWVDLQNVKTGQLRLQFHRSILTSPSLNAMVTLLMDLERSWTPEDLSRHGLQLEHLTGELAWLTSETTNPAIEHLAESIRSGSIEWKPQSLHRIEEILTSQGLCSTPGLPTAHLWFSSIAPTMHSREFVNEVRRHAPVKHVKFPTDDGFAFIDFRSVSDSLLAFLSLQHKEHHGSALEVGFGRYVPRDDPMLVACERAGFLHVFHAPLTAWAYCWVFLSNGTLHAFADLQKDTPTFTMDARGTFVCCHGLNSLEVHRMADGRSVFLRSDSRSQIALWKQALHRTSSTAVAPPGAEGTTATRSSLGSHPGLHSNGSTGRAGNKDDNGYECSVCHERWRLDEVYVREQSDPSSTADSYTCLRCLRNTILSAVASGDVASLSREFSVQDIRELLQTAEFESYLDSSLRALLDANEDFVKCPNCSVACEFVRDGAQDVPDFNRLMGVNGKPLSAETQTHYLNNRLRCRNSACSIDFCRSCLERPYHSGFTCDEYQIFKTADHCRFCDAALIPGKNLATDPPAPALARCCTASECLRKRDQACLVMLDCGHPCGGVRGETNHPPCMFDDDHRPATCVQSGTDFCNICFTETLSQSPVVDLDCGHLFHYECCKKRLVEKWPTPQISFGFCQCPLDKINMHHELLVPDLMPIWALHRDIEAKSYQRLIYEGLLKDPDLMEGGPYYRNAMGYGMSYFAFYMCFKCKVPYFGGKPACNDGLDHFDPSELVCGTCSGIGVAECATHGKEFIQFKCRFCCNLSTWHCWGTTHFCDDCHRRQEAHDYMSTKAPEELPQCEGPDKCPLGIEHPPSVSCCAHA